MRKSRRRFAAGSKPIGRFVARKPTPSAAQIIRAAGKPRRGSAPDDRRPSIWLALRNVLEHFLAGFLAFAAFRGALLHVLVIRELLASLGALVANGGACLANIGRVGSAAGHDAGRGGTDVGAILATGQRELVFSIAFADERCAMHRARIASPLASRAFLGAIGEGVVMMGIARRGRRLARLRGGGLERRGCRGKNRSSREGGEETMASHAKTPSLAKIQLAPTCFVRPGHEKCQANAHYSHSALRRFAAWRMRPDIQDALNGARFASLDPRDNYAWSPSMVSSKAKPKSKSS